jgi:hypothetical protein
MGDRDDIMRKVRALIAKADDPAVTPAEAQSFRDGADRLMTKYAIEEVELLRAGRKTTAIVMRSVDVSWYSSDDNDVLSNLHWLFTLVYRHCRCVTATSSWNWRSKTVQAFGFPGDLDWADLLFTSLMLELQRKVEPRPTADVDYFQALKMCREAGLSWPETYIRMEASGITYPDEVYTYHGDRRRDKMIRDYRAWCKRTGTPQNYNSHVTYRRSFSSGFVSGVYGALQNLADEQDNQQMDSGESYAVVLRDVYDRVREEMYQAFPNERPKILTEEELAELKSKPVKYRKPRERAMDHEARHAGWKAGREANLFNSASERIES